jgi:hypothetical protein
MTNTCFYKWDEGNINFLHDQLFSFRGIRGGCSDSQVMEVLSLIKNHPQLQYFRLWLVGSRLEPNRFFSDVDILLTPTSNYEKTNMSVTKHDIEQALWLCRSVGYEASKNHCVIDPTFEWRLPLVNRIELLPNTVAHKIKLLCPYLYQQVKLSKITEFISVGKFCIEYERSVSQTNYYLKLPSAFFKGKEEKYYRVAREIL